MTSVDCSTSASQWQQCKETSLLPVSYTCTTHSTPGNYWQNTNRSTGEGDKQPVSSFVYGNTQFWQVKQWLLYVLQQLKQWVTQSIHNFLLEKYNCWKTFWILLIESLKILPFVVWWPVSKHQRFCHSLTLVLMLHSYTLYTIRLHISKHNNECLLIHSWIQCLLNNLHLKA